MASAPGDHKAVSVHLGIAIALGVLIFLNALLGLIYLVIPKKCLRRHGKHHRRHRHRQAAIATDTEQGFRYHHHHHPPHGYEMRSIYVTGPQGHRVTIINGIVEVDDDFDAWAYWATDSEETLRGIPVNTNCNSNNNTTQQQQQQQQQHQYGTGAVGTTTTTSSSGTGTTTTLTDEYGYDLNPEMGNMIEGIIARVPDAGGPIFSLAGYDDEPSMGFAPERVVTRGPFGQGADVVPQAPQCAPTVRTWGRESDATIRAVVEDPRRDVAARKRQSRQ